MFGSTRRFQIGVNNLHICPTDEHQLEAEDGQVPGAGAPCDDRLVQPHEGFRLQRTDGGVRSLLQRGHVRASPRSRTARRTPGSSPRGRAFYERVVIVLQVNFSL